MESAKTIHINGKDYEIPEGIESWGSWYQVPLSLITVAEEENPRRLGANGDSDGLGFDKESMAELLEGIKVQGMMFPLVCYWVVEGDTIRPCIADGERRYLCADHLVDNNEICYDSATGKLRPASEVHSRLMCRVIVGDKNDGVVTAFMLHATNVAWGDGAVVKVVQKLRDSGLSDAEILDKIKKGKQWLTETDKLLALDKETFSYLLSGKITRGLGLNFANIEDLEVRHQTLLNSYSEAVDKYEVEVSEAEEDLDKAIANQELVEANLAEAVAENQDEETIEKLQQDVKKAKKKTETKQKKAEEIKAKKPKAGTKQFIRVTKGKKDRNRNIVASKILGKKGIQSQLNAIVQLISNEGKDADGNLVKDVESLYACKTCYRAILAGEEDIVKALRDTDLEEGFDEETEE